MDRDSPHAEPNESSRFPEIRTAQAEMEDVLANYARARTEPFRDHPMATLLRVDLRNSINRILERKNYVITGSPGKGNWAETPWVGVFDPFVTTTAQEGYYAVYLFRGDGASVVLSLNQATTAVRDRVGARYREVLERTARLYRDLLADAGGTTIGGPIDLGGTKSLTRGYEAGNIAAIEYRRGEVPGDDVLAADLDHMLGLYAELVTTHDALAEAAQASEDDGQHETGAEGDRFRWHKRVERNSRLANAAKKVHGTTCQACGFSFADAYGDLGVGYIEAHHLIPVAELAERPREVSSVTDFAVVCANCHRMLHRSAGRVMSISELKSLVDDRRDPLT
jgi:5-methylcytosine-specific restriction protein A